MVALLKSQGSHSQFAIPFAASLYHVRTESCQPYANDCNADPLTSLPFISTPTPSVGQQLLDP